MSKIRVLLVDDHALFREGLRAILRYYDDIEVVGEASSGVEAAAQVGILRPDIVVMDIAMPGMNGMDATRVIRERYPDTQVLVLSQHKDPNYVTAVVKSGASGYVLKQAAGADLIAALRSIARGEVFLHPAVSAAMVREIRGDSVTLTPRESEILHLIVKGQTSAEIAALLCLSPYTVDWHRSNLMQKTGARNVAELIRRSRDLGTLAEND
jgi:two-component system response regulator NreC